LISELNAVKAVMFDAGGTLVHLDSIRICRQLENHLGVAADPDRFERAQSLAWTKIKHLIGDESAERLRREYYSTLLPDLGVPPESVPAAIDLVVELLAAEMLWSRTLESTASTLAALKDRGLILAVVSNSDGRVEAALKHVGLAQYFEFILDSFVVGVEKPDARIFELAVMRAGVAPKHAAYVGDLYSVDVVGARRAGMIPVLYDPHDLQEGVDCFRIRELGELLELLSGSDGQRETRTQ
jgi:putative hydrolase of the HAD superfamily